MAHKAPTTRRSFLERQHVNHWRIQGTIPSGPPTTIILFGIRIEPSIAGTNNPIPFSRNKEKELNPLRSPTMTRMAPPTRCLFMNNVPIHEVPMEDNVPWSNYGVPKDNDEGFHATIVKPLPSSMEDYVPWSNHSVPKEKRRGISCNNCKSSSIQYGKRCSLV